MTQSAGGTAATIEAPPLTLSAQRECTKAWAEER